MRKLLGLVVFAVVLGSAGLAGAQTLSICEANCQVRQGEAFAVITDPVPGASRYVLYLNGVAQSVSWTIDADGFVSFAYPVGAYAGSYAFVIGAVVNGAEDKTDPNTLTIVKRKVKFRT
jgi:hypothetical protein